MIDDKLSVLVVEDERALADIIKRKIELSGYQAATASTVEEALKNLENSNSIGVVWLDHYLLGQGNGLDLVVKMKARPEWAKIPIFVVSNTASAEKRLSYLHLGVNEYYVKAEHTLEEIVSAVIGVFK